MVNRHTLVRVGTYAAAAGCIAAGLYLTKEEVIPLLTNPQFLHDFSCRCVPIDEFINRYNTSKPGVDALASYLLGIVIAGTRLIEDRSEGISIKETFKQVPAKASSKIINPIKERILRRNTNYVATMNYSGI